MKICHVLTSVFDQVVIDQVLEIKDDLEIVSDAFFLGYPVHYEYRVVLC